MQEYRLFYLPFADRTPMRVRREIVDCVASGEVPKPVHDALLFAGIAFAAFSELGNHSGDPAAYEAGLVSAASNVRGGHELCRRKHRPDNRPPDLP
jgi:hypothetical protein